MCAILWEQFERPAKSVKAPRHSGGMMAEEAGKNALQHPFRTIVDNKSGQSLYIATTVRRRSARWRTC
jgi:hypothetical protein